MSADESDIAGPFIKQKQKNLAYFKTYRPEIYQYFSQLEPSHAELVITPGADDVDLVVKGESLYRGVAREYSEGEVERFLQDNPPQEPLLTLRPPRLTGGAKAKASRFGYVSVKNSAKASKLHPDEFQGYFCGKVYPSIIFLGCGLGFHIKKLVETVDVLDVVVFEPDPEKFALSLFTVDWQDICDRFRKPGRSISFAIASNTDSSHVKRVLGNKLGEMVPLYPYVSRYFNHLADIELHKLVKELERDIHVVAANWVDYDFEIFPYRNAFHNLSRTLSVFNPNVPMETTYPVVVCGSGPSLDQRIESLKEVRDKVIVVSAGTGLRALFSYGVRPDFHVELDPSHLIFELLEDVRGEFGLHDITLLYSTTINPLASRLFDKSIAFFSGSNYIPALFGLWNLAIPGSNATCTNAALALSYFCGMRNIFLMGTDYGFKDKSETHSNVSVYGARSTSGKSPKMRENAQTGESVVFPVKGVNGQKMLTRADYLTAKQTVEHFLADVLHSGGSVSVRNCSDGADIEGARWMSSQDFLQAVFDSSAKRPDFHSHTHSVRDLPVSERYSLMAEEVRAMSSDLMRILRRCRLNGKKDLMILINEVRTCLGRVGEGSGRKAEVPVQLVSWGVTKGVILQFLQVGLTNGLAQADEHFLEFAKVWRNAFEEFLVKLPQHFSENLLSHFEPESDPLVLTTFRDDEPGYS